MTCVHRAWRTVVHDDRRAGNTASGVAGLGAVAAVSIGATGPGRLGRVGDPVRGVTAVGGAGIAVVDELWALEADAVFVARARSGAGRGLRTDRPSGQVLAPDLAGRRIAMSRRARVAVVYRYRRVNDPARGITRVDGAGIAVIEFARQDRSVAKPRSPAGLEAVANVTVRTRRSLGLEFAPVAVHWIAVIDGARIAVVQIERNHDRARPNVVAVLVAVANVVVVTEGTLWARRMPDTLRQRTGIGGARIAVIEIRRRTSDAARSCRTNLDAVASIAIRAGSARDHGRVRNRAVRRVAGIGRTGVVVVRVHRCAGPARAGRVACLRTVADVAVRAARAA